jgi:hypothetical protein
MNIFILSESPQEAAQLQCDKHINKMCVESAQMLSTAHRVLDGHKVKRPSKSGKRLVDYWIHPDSVLEDKLYKAVHVTHPCTIWTMISDSNYQWHYQHWVELSKEFEFRYGKPHGSYELLNDDLNKFPNNIKIGGLSRFPLAMKSNPECMFEDDPVKSYRLFYQTKQERFSMRWTKRQVPEWFEVRV